MQEAGELTRQAAVQVVNKCFEHLGLDAYGLKVVVGHGSRNEAAMTMRQCDHVAGRTDIDLTVALQAHTDDKAVVLEQVAVEGAGKLGDTRCEIRRVDDEVGRIQTITIRGTVIILYMIVERLGSQLCMQFSRTAIHARTVVVVNAIRDI